MSKELASSDLPRKIRRIISRLSNPEARAERASLRKTQEDAPPVFWEILQRHVGTDLSKSEEDNWRSAIYFLANTISAGGRDSEQSFGRACRRAGVSESRVLQLLSARGRQLRQLAPRVCRIVISKGESFNFTEVAKLILFQNSPLHEKIRRGILRSFVQVPQQQDEKEDNT